MIMMMTECFVWLIDNSVSIICDALHNLVPFVQLKKLEKQSWRTVTFSKVAG